jgi:molybdopterin-guanine dinucleotide biosynthesis protein A
MPDKVHMRTGSIILTGGRSKRMGRPKESLRIAGQTLLGRTVETLLGCTEPVVVVARAGQELPVLPAKARVISDEVADAGPLAALVAGMRFLRREDLLGEQDAVFATGCDNPFLPAAVVAWLVDRLGDAPLLMPFALGHLQPLCAVYRLAVLPAAEALLEKGIRTPRAMATAVAARVMDEAELASFDRSLRFLHNVNTPEDYQRALDELRP